MVLSQILPIIQASFLLVLVVLVAKQDWRKPISRLFLLFLGALAFWGITVAIMRLSTNLGYALFWEKAVLVMIGLTAVSFYIFVTEYTNVGSRLIGRLAIIFILVTVAIAPTDLLVRSMGIDQYGNAPDWGPLFLPWVPVSYVLVIIAAVYLEKARRASTSYEERNRYLYFIFGAVVSLIGSATDTLSAAGVPIYPMAIPANILFACITTVAIIKYHLLDIRLTLRQGAIYLLTGVVAAAPLTVVSIAWLLATNGRDISIWWLLAPVVVLALMVGPLWALAQDALKRAFYGERYDYLRALERFSDQSRGINDMNKICSLLAGLAEKTLQPSRVGIYIASERGEYKAASTLDMDVDLGDFRADTLVSWLKRTELPVWHHDIDSIPQLQAMSAEERMALNSLGAELYSLIASESQTIGLIALGPKMRGQLYTREDLRLLYALSKQAALNLENVRLLELERKQVVRLQELEKMKTEFLFTVSHQLRTPLTSIKVATELLVDRTESIPADSQRRLMGTIKNSTRDLETYITTILEFAKIENAHLELKRERIDLRNVIREVSDILMPQIKLKEQTLDLVQTDTALWAEVDQHRIKQIVSILLENAVKFTPRGGHISVNYQQSDTLLNVEVKDDGPGISPDEQQKIFDAYYQAKSRRPRDADGLGLGLAVAKKLVELHGGQIWVRSKPNQGTAFVFTIPALPLEIAAK